MLLDRNGEKTDLFQRVPVAEAAGTPHALVPVGGLADALQGRGANAPLGIEIANTQDIDSLKPHLDQLALIAIAFPAFSDGRGFSQAKRLRQAGFAGTLRAVGPLIADQFAYALACGFDEIELPSASAARQPASQWLAALTIISHGYQRGYATTQATILDQRRAARRAQQG